MKNKYEIVSSNILNNVQNQINEYLQDEEVEVFFVGGITYQDSVFCQAILRIPKVKLPVDVTTDGINFRKPDEEIKGEFLTENITEQND